MFYSKLINGKRKIFFIFVLAICFFGLIFTFYRNLFIPSVNERFITLSGPITYSASTIKKWNDWNDPSFNKPVNDIQAEYGPAGVPEKDILDYMNNHKWNWSDKFIQDQKKIYQFKYGKPLDIKDLSELQQKNPQNYILYTYAQLSKVESAALDSYATDVAKLKCNSDSSGNGIGPGMVMLDASGNVTAKYAKNNDLPNLLPGFHFLNGPCNPCNLHNNKFDCPFICPVFSLGVYPMPYTEYLWGVGEFADSQPTSRNDNENNSTGNTSGNTSSKGESSWSFV
jgi:hypothetical protein